MYTHVHALSGYINTEVENVCLCVCTFKKQPPIPPNYYVLQIKMFHPCDS